MNRAAGPSFGCGGSAGTWRRAVPAPRTSQGAAPRVFVRSAARQPATASLMERAAPSHRVPLPLLLLLAGLSVLAAPGRGAGGGPAGRGRPGSTAPALASPPTTQRRTPGKFWSCWRLRARAPLALRPTAAEAWAMFPLPHPTPSSRPNHLAGLRDLF